MFSLNFVPMLISLHSKHLSTYIKTPLECSQAKSLVNIQYPSSCISLIFKCHLFFGFTSVIAITEGLGSKVLISTCNSISLFVRVSAFVYKTDSPPMDSLLDGMFIFLLFLLLAFSFFFSPSLFSFVLENPGQYTRSPPTPAPFVSLLALPAPYIRVFLF